MVLLLTRSTKVLSGIPEENATAGYWYRDNSFCNFFSKSGSIVSCSVEILFLSYINITRKAPRKRAPYRPLYDLFRQQGLLPWHDTCPRKYPPPWSLKPFPKPLMAAMRSISCTAPKCPTRKVEVEKFSLTACNDDVEFFQEAVFVISPDLCLRDILQR